MIRCNVVILAQLALLSIVAGQIEVPAAQPEGSEFSCPCWDRGSATFSFLMHYLDPITTAGKLLRSGVHQAARDRGLRVNEHIPIQVFSVTEAVRFLEAEVQAGTAGIVTTLYNDQVIAPLKAANAAGIPVYVVGGADPDVLRALQKEEPAMGPLRASIRQIGLDIHEVGNALAAQLMSSGITHMRCIITDIGTMLWFRRCIVLVEAFRQAGLSGMWYVHSSLSLELAEFLATLEATEADVPGSAMAFVVMDSSVYANIKGPLWEGAKRDATLVVYETSVAVLQDIQDGRRVIALNANYYTQGYLALALAATELQTGQMVTSDIMAMPQFFGGHNIGSQARDAHVAPHFLTVTDADMHNEICRAARNPVCGDPGVVPVAPSGCRCFNRSEVAFKVVSGLPKRLTNTHFMWQGMVDAQRDIPGSTFHWNVYDASSFFQYGEYEEVVNSTRYAGAIVLDSVMTDLSASLANAVRSILAAGKRVYLAYSKNDARTVQEFLDEFGANAYLGPDPYSCGLVLGSQAVALDARHTLAVNLSPVTPWSWQIMHGAVTGVVGNGEAPDEVWEWPVLAHGSPDNRTGAWALYIDGISNRTVQVTNAEGPGLGSAFVGTLRKRLDLDLPAPDAVIIQNTVEFIGTDTLELLANVSEADRERPPIRLLTHECLGMGFLAMARQGRVQGEEHMMGCIDSQHYLSMYIAANLAALEQHTGERFLGWVNTARLFQAAQLPRNFTRRVHCEMDGYNRGVLEGKLGRYFPVCNLPHGCILDPLDGKVCSGHGTCYYEGDAAGVTDQLKFTCHCDAGWLDFFCQTQEPTVDRSDRTSHVLLIALLTTGCALLLAAAFVVFFVARRRRGADDAKAFEEFLLKRTPPGRGDQMAAIVTDIEGSTGLWEWNSAAMNKSLVIHHKVLRSLLPKYYGYESDTEGDSFTVVFHDAVDALGWAMEVQRQLLFPASLSIEQTETSPTRKIKGKEAGGKGAQGEGAHLPDWPTELLETEAAKEVKDAVDGSVLYRGLRVRMGIHIGMPESCIVHPNGRQHYQGEVVELTKAIQGAAASGGQVLMSMVAWHSLGMHMRSVICQHMGMHEVGERLPAVHLMQVLPQELVKRTPFLPLKSKQLWPSFFDAPCARECYLKPDPPKQPVVICFMYVGSASVLRRTPGYQQAINLLVGFVQSRLAQFEAYECEEKDGNFLLAFRSPVMAAQFAEAIQREAMHLDWPEKLLEQDAAAEVVKLAGDKGDGASKAACVVFRGLRLQIGLCMGVPSDCHPHMATGRAAYFGPVVNRAARIAATAAHGQTLANHEVVEGIKGLAEKVSFQELGEFGLKGVKEPLRLYQISSEALDHRLFPRTLKLAKSFFTSVGQDEISSEGKHAPQVSSQTKHSLQRAGSLTFIPVKLEGSIKKGYRASFSVRAQPMLSPSSIPNPEVDLAELSYDDLLERAKGLMAEVQALRTTSMAMG